MSIQNAHHSLPPEVLAEIPLFKGLGSQQLEQILSHARRKRSAQGEFFFFQGDPAERLYLLERGRVKLTQSGIEGQQVLLQMIQSASVFGVVALAHDEQYPVFAEAAEDSEALYWNKTDLLPLINRYPQLALNAIKVLAGHVREFQERYRQLATERVERRLARTLLRLASQAGRKTPEGVLIDLPLTRRDLADMTGTTLYTVSRTLSRWEAQGLISSRRERVVIVFPHGLVSIAEDLPSLNASAENFESS